MFTAGRDGNISWYGYRYVYERDVMEARCYANIAMQTFCLKLVP